MTHWISSSMVFFLLLTASAAPYVVREGEDWKKIHFDVTKIKEDSILDFSKILNHHRPAGKYGYLKVVGEHFEFEKLPGVKQRFFGVNLCQASCIPPKEWAAPLAESIARAGYNSVRLHQFDNYIIKKGIDSSTELDPELIDRMDYLIKQLKDRGLYVTIDLYASRKVTEKEIPEIMHPVEKLNYKRAVLILDSARQNFLTFARNLLTHRNPYTEMTYAEDPVFCFVALMNEDNIWGWSPDPEKKNRDVFGWIWEERFVEWCKKNKIPEKRRADAGLRQHFFQKIYKAYFDQVSAELRRIGVRVPFSDQNCDQSSCYSLTRRILDYTDFHFYLSHPNFVGNKWGLPALHQQRSFVELFPDGRTSYFPAQRIHGRPFVSTEMRWCYPMQGRGESGAIVGALAGLQDYDALYTFQWAHGGERYLGESMMGTNFFDLYADPVGYLTDRITHLLFLRGDVAASDIRAALLMPKDAAKLDQKLKNVQLPILCGELGMVMRTGTFTSTPAGCRWFWPFGDPRKASALSKRLQSADLGKGVFDPDNRRYVSTTGETEFNGKAGTFRIASPRSEALVFVGAGSWKADALSVENQTKYSTYFASAMDGKNLRDSGRILFFHLNNVLDSGTKFEDESMKQWNTAGKLPHLAHRATGEVSLRLAAGEAPKVYAVNLKGERMGEIASIFHDGLLKFTADTNGLNDEAVLVYEIAR